MISRVRARVGGAGWRRVVVAGLLGVVFAEI